MIHYKIFDRIAGGEENQFDLKSIKLTYKVSDTISKKYNEIPEIKIKIKNMLAIISNLGSVLEHVKFFEDIHRTKQTDEKCDKYVLFMIYNLSSIVKESLKIITLLNNEDINSWLIKTSLKNEDTGKIFPIFDFYKENIHYIENDGYFPKISWEILHFDEGDEVWNRNITSQKIKAEVLKKEPVNDNKTSVPHSIKAYDLYNKLLYYTFIFYILFYAPKWQNENGDRLVNVPLKKMTFGDSSFYNRSSINNISFGETREEKMRKQENVSRSICEIL
jgi:hypothetical protein